MATGFGVSGQAFVGADIGGFAGNSHAELYLRWMQYGVLTPFCRNHSGIGNVDQYAWAWGETVQDLVREALRLRYRLMPYIYATFITASETGAPVQRPLVFDYQDDPLVRDIDDQYLFGPDLLVAPVVAPGQTARQVYLPEGDWYDWYSGRRYDGRSFALVPTPMESIPVFARGGAVIPMWPEAPSTTAGYHPQALELLLFVPSTDGVHTSTLHEDDGLTFAAGEGKRYRTAFTVTRTGSRVEVRADVEGEGYPEFAREAFRLVVRGAVADRVRVDGRVVELDGDSVMFPNAGAGFTAELDLAPTA
jgi:alpha-glucosidase